MSCLSSEVMGSHQEGLVGVQDGDIVTRENILETTRLQLAGVVLKIADEVLEFGTVHRKVQVLRGAGTCLRPDSSFYKPEL